jgi:hypothetical protein
MIRKVSPSKSASRSIRKIGQHLRSLRELSGMDAVVPSLLPTTDQPDASALPLEMARVAREKRWRPLRHKRVLSSYRFCGSLSSRLDSRVLASHRSRACWVEREASSPGTIFENGELMANPVFNRYTDETSFCCIVLSLACRIWDAAQRAPLAAAGAKTAAGTMTTE